MVSVLAESALGLEQGSKIQAAVKNGNYRLEGFIQRSGLTLALGAIILSRVSGPVGFGHPVCWAAEAALRTVCDGQVEPT